ncbi:DUF922 domain-containing protein [Aureibacter tunicatorum]|nr:DUF922 domain-containing protein [Aureibacter tunicatorum]BDD04565.1 hypothetical protein AUTU_20480 [Aureibacter tunicatorum]
MNQKHKTFVYWKQIEWNDFKGNQQDLLIKDNYAANISSHIILEEDSVLPQKAHAVMYPYKSSKVDKKKTDYLLNHEQYHFNITEAFARKLNRAIEYDTLASDEKIKVIHQLISHHEKIWQADYDKETEHGRNNIMQKYWEYRIDSLLIECENPNYFNEAL